MTRWMRELRLIPVALFAVVCLFVLKVLGLVLDGGYALDHAEFGNVDRRVNERAVPAKGPRLPPPEMAPAAKRSWAQEILNYPGGTGGAAEKPAEPSADASLVTGSVLAERQAKQNAEKTGITPNPAPNAVPGGRVIQLERVGQSPAERAILERLGERRHQLDTRSREMEIRENLLKAQEQQMQNRMRELNDAESRVNGAAGKRDELEAARFKALVVMYENMRAKDAAKIFDRLDLKILVEVASQINPRRMGDIMAQMTPQAAERLTVELAQHAAGSARPPTEAELPKIEGQPIGR